MLTTNLSTRPFYNERAVHLVLIALWVVAMSILAVGVARVVDLARSHTALTAEVERAEREAADLSTQTLAIHRAINDADLEDLASATQEANHLIDRRIFSWTEFFNRIEQTLPENVMLTSVRPSIEAPAINVSVGVIGRQVEDINHFIEQLEATGAFADILAREEEITQNGMYRALVRGRYFPSDKPVQPMTTSDTSPSS